MTVDMDFNAIHKNAILETRAARAEKDRKNIEKIQIASNELFGNCIDNLQNKIEIASKKGLKRLRLYSNSAYEKINDLPIVFLAFGGKIEGYEMFTRLNVKSVHNQLAECFKGSPFRFTIRTTKNEHGQKQVDFDLFWS